MRQVLGWVTVAVLCCAAGSAAGKEQQDSRLQAGSHPEDAPAPARSRAAGSFGALGEDTLSAPPPDPLLRSGLLLAGAGALTASSASPPSPHPTCARWCPTRGSH
jgi:hypothetical protein